MTINGYVNCPLEKGASSSTPENLKRIRSRNIGLPQCLLGLMWCYCGDLGNLKKAIWTHWKNPGWVTPGSTDMWNMRNMTRFHLLSNFPTFPRIPLLFAPGRKAANLWRHLGSFVSFTNNLFPMWVSSAIACLVQIPTSFSFVAVPFFVGAEEEWLLAEKLASKLAINKWLLRYLFQEPWVPMTWNLVEIWKYWKISLLALHTV